MQALIRSMKRVICLKHCRTSSPTNKLAIVMQTGEVVLAAQALKATLPSVSGVGD